MQGVDRGEDELVEGWCPVRLETGRAVRVADGYSLAMGMHYPEVDHAQGASGIRLCIGICRQNKLAKSYLRSASVFYACSEYMDTVCPYKLLSFYGRSFFVSSGSVRIYV